MSLDNLISPEIKNDALSEWLVNLAARENIKTILEIGSSDGTGSTSAIFNGMQLNKVMPRLFCLEVSKLRFAELQARYAKFPAVKCYNMASVRLSQMMSEVEVRNFHALHRSSMNIGKYSVDEVCAWLKNDVDYVLENNIPQGGIATILVENGLTKFDLVLIDGSAFSGLSELRSVWGSRIIAMDDVADIKCWEAYKAIKVSPEYKLIAEDLSLRNGYAVFQRITNE